ncbi:MAG: amylo-alpha-1,6-glucosidase [Bacteroidales bacterium]|jgi:predicted glycogen debranching enzyme|nr:glycogen debranching enzyme N-terminal domain-containing protein [Bacteroidales bacterium]MDD3131766.1 amylo-alpha-1,6-glucosidase [Bacteroidales bacterium]NLO49838.1 amylo-alpha-1,6-glucosidase [Bacteroidales bacterium]
MAYIQFDKAQLINLEYCLKREWLRTNRAGAYSASTIVNCNTRKYHGLLVVPQPQFGNTPHVLLSALHETVIQHDAEFNLGIHKYQNNTYHPKGHKYVRDFQVDPVPVITYRVGGVVLVKEILFSSNEEMMMIRYTLKDAHSPTTLRLTPFLAFRQIHALCKANNDVHTDYQPVPNGAAFCMYPGYSTLFLQASVENKYTHQPDWYFNVEYTHEKLRGYDYLEDLYVPGHIEFKLKKGESLILSASIRQIKPKALEEKFAQELKSRTVATDFRSALDSSARQFVITKNDKPEIVAGYPWYGVLGRDTFMALPGLLLTRGDTSTYLRIIDNMIARMQGPFFPTAVLDTHSEYHSVDTQLWFFWALQKYASHTHQELKLWQQYQEVMKKILEAYAEGTWFNIRMQSSGLLTAGEEGYPLTWMNAVDHGRPVTPRAGNPVEVNALWYNAIMFALELAKAANDRPFIKRWSRIAHQIRMAFVENFWSETRGYLADFTNADFKDFSVRPNMLLAASLPFSPLDELKRKKILDVIARELLTSRGLRTLSPKNIRYKGKYHGNSQQRDEACHQGTVVAWLAGHYAEAYLMLYGKNGLPVVKNIFKSFEEETQKAGLSSISEFFDGDPPHDSAGATHMAIAVAELLRIDQMIKQMEK